jgi:hypothetical protein
MPAGDAQERLTAELNQRYPEAKAAIKVVLTDLRRTRSHRPNLGDIYAPTAHEAAVEMVHALNRQDFGFEILGRRPVQNWPEVGEVIAEIELETTEARRLREAGPPLDLDKLREATEGAPQQFELIRMLVDAGGKVDFDDLMDPVWNGKIVTTAAVRKMIGRANQTLKRIGARVHIRCTGEAAIIS